MEIVTDHAEYDIQPSKKRKHDRQREKKYTPVVHAKNALYNIKAENHARAEKKRRFLASQDARYADWEKENGSLARTVVSSDGTVTEFRGRLPFASNCHGLIRL